MKQSASNVARGGYSKSATSQEKQRMALKGADDRNKAAQRAKKQSPSASKRPKPSAKMNKSYGR